MTETLPPQPAILVKGEGKIPFSLVICLLLAKQRVVLWTEQPADALHAIESHLQDVGHWWALEPGIDALEVTTQPATDGDFSMAIACTPESLAQKLEAVKALEDLLPASAVLAINTESLSLQEIQASAKNARRIIGANWVEPVHTTYFLEIIANDVVDDALVQAFIENAKLAWNKDPYLVSGNFGIRSRLICALIREAFHLVEDGYVSNEDIDRACRNDAGYYLPFAGNFRYMDLMGTYIYGIVMKDMNPDLTKRAYVPEFFQRMIGGGKTGMAAGEGFYAYSEQEIASWRELSRKFSYQVKEIVDKYQQVV